MADNDDYDHADKILVFVKQHLVYRVRPYTSDLV